MHNIFSHNPVPTLIVNKEGEIIEYNKTMVELTGYLHKEVPNIHTWMEILCPDKENRSKSIKIGSETYHRGIEINGHESIIKRKDGELRYSINFTVSMPPTRPSQARVWA